MKAIKRALAENTSYVDTSTGAPAPDPSSRWWNDWAANNPTATALALRKVNLVDSGLLSKTGILGSAARPIDCE